MTSPEQMKPADQTLFLLGQIDGKLGSLQQSVEATFANQASVNAANLTEHARLDHDINQNARNIAALQANQPSKLPPITIVVGLVAISGFVLALLDRIYT